MFADIGLEFLLELEPLPVHRARRSEEPRGKELVEHFQEPQYGQQRECGYRDDNV